MLWFPLSGVCCSSVHLRPVGSVHELSSLSSIVTAHCCDPCAAIIKAAYEPFARSQAWVDESLILY